MDNKGDVIVLEICYKGDNQLRGTSETLRVKTWAGGAAGHPTQDGSVYILLKYWENIYAKFF